MFSDEIINFIAENFERKDFCDISFLDKFRKVLIHKYDLGSKIVRIRPSRLDSDTTLLYKNREILFDMRRIEDDIKCKARNNGIKITDDYRSFEWFAGVIHEYLHVIDDLMCMNKNDISTFTNILRDTHLILKGYLKLGDSNLPIICQRRRTYKLYQKYHDIFPSERFADVVSYNVMIQLFKMLYPEKREILENFKNVYLQMLMDGYEFKCYSCPIEKFYSIIERLDVFYSYDFSKYDEDERFIYGMPISSYMLEEQKRKIFMI